MYCVAYRQPRLPCLNINVKVMSTSDALYPLFTQCSLRPIRHNHIIASIVANKVYMRNVTVFIYYLISSVKWNIYGLSPYKFYILDIKQYVFIKPFLNL